MIHTLLYVPPMRLERAANILRLQVCCSVDDIEATAYTFSTTVSHNNIVDMLLLDHPQAVLATLQDV